MVTLNSTAKVGLTHALIKLTQFDFYEEIHMKSDEWPFVA